MAVDVADVDRDGMLDIFVADMLSPIHSLRMTQSDGSDRVPPDIGGLDDRPQIRRNTLFFGRTDGTYLEAANYAGVEASDWTWSAAFVDVDLDGYEDLLTGNGHAFDTQDLDAIERTRGARIAGAAACPAAGARAADLRQPGRGGIGAAVVARPHWPASPLGRARCAGAHGLADHVAPVGFACNLVYSTLDADGRPSQPYRTLLLQELIRRGVLAPSLVVSYSHTDDDVDRTIEAFDGALQVYAKALVDGVEPYLIGPPSRHVFDRRWR